MKRALSVRAAVAAAVALAGLTTVGCGGPTAKPQGKILMNGQPFAVEKGETFQLTFVGEGDPSQKVTCTADVHPDGTFTVDGPTNNGLPTGKYHITATCTNPYAADPKNRGDKFKGAYADPSKTPFTVDISSSKPPPITIDVGKGTVAAGT